MEKVCIVGAGAIGGFIGTRLARAGEAEVCALARGETLAALRTSGWRLRMGGELLQAPAVASEHAAELGIQDLVILALKGQALPAVAPTLTPLIGPGTVVLPAMNGVPWWFLKTTGDLDDAPLQSVDPGGVVGAALPFATVLGGVVHASTSTAGPGLVEHRMGQGLIVGEPAGGTSERARRVAALLAGAGFEATVSENIRRDIWFKLWGNLTINPISAITGATADRILDDPLVRAFCSATMGEVAAIGAHIGCPIDQSPEDRHQITRKLGAFRSSMLQDVQAGRAIELDAIVGAVQEIARRLGLATPNVDALLGLTRLFGRVHGLYPDAPGA